MEDKYIKKKLEKVVNNILYKKGIIKKELYERALEKIDSISKKE